mmetsp:Transcript_121672/g.389258  ORF Transcript_121672/g.389258 Transcript_121672/m.389258 type:complete len:123 (-) Transcript_121672:500-868(-)
MCYQHCYCYCQTGCCHHPSRCCSRVLGQYQYTHFLKQTPSVVELVFETSPLASPSVRWTCVKQHVKLWLSEKRPFAALLFFEPWATWLSAKCKWESQPCESCLSAAPSADSLQAVKNPKKPC